MRVQTMGMSPIRRYVSSVLGVSAAAVVVLATPSGAEAQGRAALGGGGIGRVGNTGAANLSTPGYLAFDSYTVASGQFLNRRPGVPSGLLASSMSVPGGLAPRPQRGRRPSAFSPPAGGGMLPLGGTIWGSSLARRGFQTAGNAALAGGGAMYANYGVSTKAGIGLPGLGYGLPATPWFLPTGASLSRSTDAALNIPGALAPSNRAWARNAAEPGRATVRPTDSAVPVPPPASLTPGERLSLQRTARSRSYLARAWEHFKTKDYHRALGTFRVAQSVATTEAVAEAESGSLYAALAMERYSLAATLLGRLLRKDPQLFHRDDHVADRYETPADYAAALQRVRRSAEVAGAGAGYQALYAYTLWQKGERLEARALAREIAERNPDGPFASMVQRMLAAEAASPAGPNASG